MLAHQFDDVIVAGAGHVARHRMVGLEDETSTLGGVQLREHRGFEIRAAYQAVPIEPLPGNAKTE